MASLATSKITLPQEVADGIIRKAQGTSTIQTLSAHASAIVAWPVAMQASSASSSVAPPWDSVAKNADAK